MASVISAVVAAVAAVAVALIARGNARASKAAAADRDYTRALVDTLEKDKASLRREMRSREERCDRRVEALEARIQELERRQ